MAIWKWKYSTASPAAEAASRISSAARGDVAAGREVGVGSRVGVGVGVGGGVAVGLGVGVGTGVESPQAVAIVATTATRATIKYLLTCNPRCSLRMPPGPRTAPEA